MVQWRGLTARSYSGQTHIWLSHGLRLSSFILFLMAIAAPYLAACIHSMWVVHRGWRLYNAEIGGANFFDLSQSQQIPAWATLVSLVVPCLIGAVPTLLVLLPFRRRRVVSWLVWICCVGGWTVFLFQNEFAIK